LCYTDSNFFRTASISSTFSGFSVFAIGFGGFTAATAAGFSSTSVYCSVGGDNFCLPSLSDESLIKLSSLLGVFISTSSTAPFTKFVVLSI
jgi:hypothetical protein